MGDRISSFEDMRSWQAAIELAVSVYRMTVNFPATEQFGLTNQMRRAATSVSANIAEGFGRNTNKDKLQFYAIAYGSLLEVKSFLYLSEKLKYLNSAKLDSLLEQITSLQKMLNASRRALKS